MQAGGDGRDETHNGITYPPHHLFGRDHDMCVYIRVSGARSADNQARAGGSGAGGPTEAAPLSQI